MNFTPSTLKNICSALVCNLKSKQKNRNNIFKANYSFILLEVCNTEIPNTITSFKNKNKTHGPDTISAKILLKLKEYVLEPILLT